MSYPFIRIFFLCVCLFFVMTSCSDCPGNEIPNPGVLWTDLPFGNSLRRPEFTFPSTVVNQVVKHEFLLYNRGGENIELLSIGFDPFFKKFKNNFTMKTNFKTPLILSPGKSNGVKVTIIFQPDKEGTTYTSGLLLTSPPDYYEKANQELRIKIFGSTL